MRRRIDIYFSPQNQLTSSPTSDLHDPQPMPARVATMTDFWVLACRGRRTRRSRPS